MRGGHHCQHLVATITERMFLKPFGNRPKVRTKTRLGYSPKIRQEQDAARHVGKGFCRDQTGNRFGDRCVPKVLEKRLSAPLKSLIVKALRGAWIAC
jgi:hypothetical protein